MSNMFCILLPSVLAIKVIEILIGERSIKNNIIDYLSLLLISNYILIILIAIKNGFQFNLINYINDNMLFSIKYLSVSIIINVLLAFVYSILIKNIKISLERISDNEKK